MGRRIKELLEGRGERAAIAQFVLSGIAAVAVIVVLGLVAFGRTGTHEAIWNAEEATRLAGEGIVAPNVGPGVLRGDRAAIARLDRVVRERVKRGPVARVIVMRPSGEVVYSDAPRMIGERRELRPEQRRALATGTAQARVTDPKDPPEGFDQGTRLLDVYQPIRAANGEPLLLQSCRRFESVSAGSKRLLSAFAPYLIGGVVLLQLINLPLALALVRRVRRARREREELLQRAIAASDHERRRIATDLHNGVVQDLAGLSMSLSAAAPGDPDTAKRLKAAAASSRQTTRELRHLLVGIYPPSLQRAGLKAALADLLETARRRGIEAHGEIPDGLELPPDASALTFRVAQEALRNVVVHSGADRVDVAVRNGDGVELVVGDDGRGFDPESLPAENGHFGLRMMSDLVEEAGGELDVDSAPGEGTRLRARIPLA
jgi:two-component system, NarL family, sensor kinase